MGGDGYESDAGYISESGKKKTGKNKEKRDGSTMNEGDGEMDKKERTKEAKTRAKEEKMLEKKEKEEERKRKKSLISLSKASKKSDEKEKDWDPFAANGGAGYETDGVPSSASKYPKSPSKSKPKKLKPKDAGAEVGYETDAGYASSASNLKSKSKSRFFGRLGSKSSKGDLQQQHPEVIPDVPSLDRGEREAMVPLPIASRFATTLGAPSLTPPVGVVLGMIENESRIETPLPPLSFSASVSSAFISATATTNYSSSATTPSSYPTPSLSSTESSSINRTSHGSAESVGTSSTGSSNNPKRKGGLFIGRDRDSGGLSTSMAGAHHGGGSGSYSTITQHDHPQQYSPSPGGATHPSTSSSSSHTSASPSSTSRFPAISFPITRSVSPAPSTAPLSPMRPHAPDQHSHNQNTLVPPSSYLPNSQSRAPSRAPSPSRLIPGPPPSTFPSPRPSDNLNLRPNSRNSNYSQAVSRNGYAHRNTPSELVIPSSSYLVPSPRSTPLPSPSVLAYYDIPPPSPPPAGPLPSVPGTSTGAGPLSSPLRVMPRARNHEQGGGSIRRGRESPFPARPILAGGGTVPIGAGGAGAGGLESRVRVRRYRDLYALPSPPGGWGGAGEQRGGRGKGKWRDEENDDDYVPGIHLVEPSESGWGEGRNDEDDEDDMRDVLDRFEETRGSQVGAEGRALGRSRSFEALEAPQKNHPHPRGSLEADDDSSIYPEEDATAAERSIFDHSQSDQEEGGDRTSRWSGSIYSRASFLDPDKSEETRDRFIQRVEAMMRDEGREQVIPPVPKIPEGLVRTGTPTVTGKRWNLF